MALRKPLFMSIEGFFEEMASADSMALGALTMGGNIDMWLMHKIVNLATPTADGDAANKVYVDGVASGAVPTHQSQILYANTSLTKFIPSRIVTDNQGNVVCGNDGEIVVGIP